MRFGKAINHLLAILLMAAAAPTQANELAVKNQSKTKDAIIIPIAPLARFNGITQQDLYKTRKNAVEKYRNLLADTYEPSDSIFGMCENKKPWWGVWGMHVFRQGEHAIEGPSKESGYILNPFRLVAAEANNVGLWDREKMSDADMRNPDFPFLWESSPVNFNAKAGIAQVVYDLTSYNQRLKTWKRCMRFPVDSINGFSLIAYNARDFGYSYAYLDPIRSRGLSKWGVHPVNISQFLHCGGSCGYPGGCNNMSPHIRELDQNKILQLPARAYLKLWKVEPDSVSDPPDFVFVIDFK
jgi:hypothetical protein